MNSLIIFFLFFIIAHTQFFGGYPSINMHGGFVTQQVHNPPTTWTNIQGKLATHQWPSTHGPGLHVQEQPKSETTWTNIQGDIALRNWPVINRPAQPDIQITNEQK